MAIIDTHIAKKSVDDGMSLHIDYEVILKKNNQVSCKTLVGTLKYFQRFWHTYNSWHIKYDILSLSILSWPILKVDEQTRGHFWPLMFNPLFHFDTNNH